MKRYLFPLLMLLSWHPLHALAQGPLTWSWVNTTVYNDCTNAACDNGTPLPITAITSSTLTYGPCQGSPPAIGNPSTSLTVLGGLTHATTPTLAAGAWCATVANNVGAVTGEPTNVSSGTVPSVSLPLTVYTLDKTKGRLLVLPYGTAPAGTACDKTQQVILNGVTYSLVLGAVTSTGNVTSLTPLAVCP